MNFCYKIWLFLLTSKIKIKSFWFFIDFCVFFEQRAHQVKEKSKWLYFNIIKVKMMILDFEIWLFIDIKNRNKVILIFWLLSASGRRETSNTSMLNDACDDDVVFFPIDSHKRTLRSIYVLRKSLTSRKIWGYILSPMCVVQSNSK